MQVLNITILKFKIPMNIYFNKKYYLNNQTFILNIKKHKISKNKINFPYQNLTTLNINMINLLITKKN